MSPDLINGLFETFGALLVFNHCRVTLRDRQVKGVSITSSALFTLWGWWNIFYYSHLDQWYSLCGGTLLMLGNTIWVALLIYYVSGNRTEAKTLLALQDSQTNHGIPQGS